MMPPQPGLGMMGGQGGPGGDFWQRIMMQRAAQGGGAPGGMPQRQSLPGLPAAGSTGGPIARQNMPGLARTSMNVTPNRAAPGMGGGAGTAARDQETYQGSGQRAPMQQMQRPAQQPMQAAQPGQGNRLAMLQNRIAAIRGAGGLPGGGGGMAAGALGPAVARNMMF